MLKIKKSTAILSLCSVLLFSSCDNFLDGSDIKDQINTQIEYANASSYVVRVEAEEGSGSITAGAGDHSLKVTDTLTVSFSKASGYKFLKWQAVNKTDSTVSMSDYVTFKDESSLETVLTFTKAADNIQTATAIL